MNSKYIDIINKEYLLEDDKGRPWEELHKRDRSIYLQAMTSGVLKKHSSKHDLLKSWQSARLTTLPNIEDLSQFLCAATKYTSYIFLCLSFLLGITVMASFLYYTGQKAVNVLSFFLTFIVVQWCFLLISFFLHQKPTQSPCFFFIKRTINFLSQKIIKQAHTQKREELHLLLGILWQKSDFIALLKPYIFVLQQKVALVFNLGLLFILSLKIIGTDLAFGWQSTLHLTSEGIFRLVQILSAPWAWTGFPTPNMAQIIGSKITLKDGIFHLFQSDLASWWPFLAMSLISYVFLPRCILLVYALVQERRTLTRFSQNNRHCKNILQRMQSPVVESHIDVTSKYLKTSPKKNSPSFTENSQYKKALLLVSYDIFPLEPKTLQQWLQEEGYSDTEQLPFMKNYGEDKALLSNLTNSEKDIVLFMEAHMPPLAEFLSFLQRLQDKTEAYVHISLVKLTQHAFSKIVSRDSFQIWNQKVNALGNNHIRVTPPHFEEEQ